MSHVLKYHKNASYHFAIAEKIYRTCLKSSKLQKKSHLSVLDIGCGSGNFIFDSLYPLLPRDFSELIGVDKDKAMIDYCNKNEIDPRISFDVLDMDKNLPEKFRNRFDYLFSSYCLLYLNNLRLALSNCHQMLKPNGEMIFVSLYKLNPVHCAHKELSKMERWNPYTKEYKDFTPLFSSDDPNSEIENLFKTSGLKLLAYGFQNIKVTDTTRNFRELFQSMDDVLPRIPEEDKADYLKVFSRLSLKNFQISEGENLDREVEVITPVVHIHAEKQLC